MIPDVEYSAALIAGLLSFFTPCILPLVPSYFSFITGISVDRLSGAEGAEVRRKIVLSTLAFVFGFSIVFIVLGATAAYFSTLLQGAKVYIRIVGGALIIVLGLHLMGVMRIKFLDIEKRAHLSRKPVHFMGTVLIGMAFGAGWSPCIGPMLGSILILAGNQDTVMQGVTLLSLYSAGLALPFIVLSIGIHFLIAFVRRAARAIRYLNIGAGALLILTGLLLITDKLRLLAYLSF